MSPHGNIIDLRSDTVTQPTEEMRQAMARAQLGDDVFGEDPTVNRLEETAAEMMGKEKALFIPSGTMGNLAAVLAHTVRGDAVILDKEAHIYYYEAGGASLVGGVQLWPMAELQGLGGLQRFREAIRPPDQHFAPARLLCLENTHNRKGGAILTPQKQEEFYREALSSGLPVHLDGARIFNAAEAAGCRVTDFTRCCHSVMFSLSKGLGAPAGSMLAGSTQFIDLARRYRKILGGGMRQSGVLAAAGLEALEHAPFLGEDHRRAQELARGLASIKNFKIEPDPPPTNIVILNLEESTLSPQDFVNSLEEEGIKTLPFGSTKVRMVLHRDIDDNDIRYTVEKVQGKFP